MCYLAIIVILYKKPGACLMLSAGEAPGVFLLCCFGGLDIDAWQTEQDSPAGLFLAVV